MVCRVNRIIMRNETKTRRSAKKTSRNALSLFDGCKENYAGKRISMRVYLANF